jgi:hypothetical protein
LALGVHDLLQQAYTVHRDNIWRVVHGMQEEYTWYQSRATELVECMQQFVLCGIGAAVSTMHHAQAANPTLVHKTTQIINKHFHNQDNGFALSDSEYVKMSKPRAGRKRWLDSE